MRGKALKYTNSMILMRSLESNMGTTRKTITVTEQQDQWIKAQIEGGGFTNDSEYIRASITGRTTRSERSE